MGGTTRKAKASSRRERLAVLITDTHYPLHDIAAEHCVRAAVIKVQPDTLYHLGDVGEWDSISHWRYKRQSRPPVDIEVERLTRQAADVAMCMNDLDAACRVAGVREKICTLGNHDEWLNYFVEKNPTTRDEKGRQYKPEHVMEFKQRGWKWHEYGDIARICGSKLFAYHGHFYSNQHHAKTHAEKMGASIVYGHHHDQQTHGVSHLTGAHRAWSLGCLRTMDADFLGNRPTNWSHNFGIVHILPSGNFQLQVVDIVDGGCFLWGEFISGKTTKAKK